MNNQEIADMINLIFAKYPTYKVRIMPKSYSGNYITSFHHELDDTHNMAIINNLLNKDIEIINIMPNGSDYTPSIAISS